MQGVAAQVGGLAVTLSLRLPRGHCLLLATFTVLAFSPLPPRPSGRGPHGLCPRQDPPTKVQPRDWTADGGLFGSCRLQA